MAEPNPSSMWTEMFLSCQIERMRQKKKMKKKKRNINRQRKKREVGKTAMHADNCINDSYEADELQFQLAPAW